MAILKGELDFDKRPLAALAKQFPSVGGRALSLLGKRARTLLKEDYLSGQEINLRKYPVDKRGRYTITSNVNRRRDRVKVWSYPVNLFEKGRTLRNGRREAPKRIITGKLKQAVMSRMGTYSREIENEILNVEIKKAGL